MVQYAIMSSTMQKLTKKPASKKTGPGFEAIFKNDIAAAIDYICSRPQYEFPLTELSANTGISSRNVYRVIDVLIARNLVRKEKMIGGARMFVYNDRNKEANILRECWMRLRN
jgi:DNA-binding MarR family transcriptional regulator